MPESFYSTSAVARLFEINRVTIYRWVKKGTVKAYKVGKNLKIPASEVERLWREFGFPEGASMQILDTHRKNRKEKGEHRKKLVVAIDRDK